MLSVSSVSVLFHASVGCRMKCYAHNTSPTRLHTPWSCFSIISFFNSMHIIYIFFSALSLHTYFRLTHGWKKQLLQNNCKHKRKHNHLFTLTASYPGQVNQWETGCWVDDVAFTVQLGVWSWLVTRISALDSKQQKKKNWQKDSSYLKNLLDETLMSQVTTVL